MTLHESDGRIEARSLRFPLDARSRLGKMEQRAAGEMAGAGDRLTRRGDRLTGAVSC